MKERFACLSRVTLSCLLLAAPAVADSIPNSVALPGSIANEWNPKQGFRVVGSSSLAEISRGTGLEFSVSGAWPGDPLLAVRSDVSTLLSGLVSDRIMEVGIAIPPNALPPDPVPEPSSLLVVLGSGIFGLASMLARRCWFRQSAVIPGR